MKFDHFVFTRFNLRKKDWVNTKNKKLVLTDDWHKARFKLFEHFCFHAMKHQSNTHFTWVVLFDTTTSPKFRKKINQLFSEFSHFKALFVDGMDSFMPAVVNYVKQHCKADYVITSRLDNDDFVSINFIQTIQDEFSEQKYMALDFVDGYTLKTQPNFQLGYHLNVFNPFISLIEKNTKNITTVWDKDHASWKREPRVKQIRNKLIWMSIIHTDNKVNEFLGFGKPKIEVVKKNFTFHPHIIPQIDHNLKIPFLKRIFNLISVFFNFYFKLAKRKIGIYKVK